MAAKKIILHDTTEPASASFLLRMAQRTQESLNDGKGMRYNAIIRRMRNRKTQLEP